jgi:hypothetical protein
MAIEEPPANLKKRQKIRKNREQREQKENKCNQCFMLSVTQLETAYKKCILYKSPMSKIGKELEQTFLQTRHTNDQKAHKKMLTALSVKGTQPNDVVDEYPRPRRWQQ